MLNTTDFNVIWKEKTGSTNEDLASCVETLPGGSVIAAISQTRGRGQSDHKWHSGDGQNLTFSILLKYGPRRPFAASDQQRLTMASSLAVVDFLKENNVEAAIKMPNDIYVKDKKICGMLIENGLRGGKMKWSIVGIGVNINEKSFPDELPNPVSLSMLTGKEYDIKKCLSDLLRHFVVRFDAIWTDSENLEKEYRDCLNTLVRR